MGEIDVTAVAVAEDSDMDFAEWLRCYDIGKIEDVGGIEHVMERSEMAIGRDADLLAAVFRCDIFQKALVDRIGRVGELVVDDEEVLPIGEGDPSDGLCGRRIEVTCFGGCGQFVGIAIAKGGRAAFQ